jgi:hypothetical protein
MIDDFWYLTPLSAIFQLYHGNGFSIGRSRRTTDHGQATGKL